MMLVWTAASLRRATRTSAHDMAIPHHMTHHRRMCFLESTSETGPRSGRWWLKCIPWETGSRERVPFSEIAGSRCLRRYRVTQFM